mmetsp:Transcript_16157/g.40520  ORF Transcript_16157/g.40520 Transcript_16157/m.40520 type:complete len:253 (+) Transcript_16157:855-1613(+)
MKLLQFCANKVLQGKEIRHVIVIVLAVQLKLVIVTLTARLAIRLFLCRWYPRMTLGSKIFNGWNDVIILVGAIDAVERFPPESDDSRRNFRNHRLVGWAGQKLRQWFSIRANSCPGGSKAPLPAFVGVSGDPRIGQVAGAGLPRDKAAMLQKGLRCRKVSIVPHQGLGAVVIFEIVDLFLNGRQDTGMPDQVMVETRCPAFSGSNNQKSRTAPSPHLALGLVSAVVGMQKTRRFSHVFEIFEIGVAIVIGGH